MVQDFIFEKREINYQRISINFFFFFSTVSYFSKGKKKKKFNYST